MKIGHLFVICLGLLVVGCGNSDTEKEEPGSSTDAVENTVQEDQASEATAKPAAATAKPPAEDVELSIVSWEETQQRIALHKGKIVVLDAWSTSCGPCMKEFPHLVKLHHDRGGKGVVCMSLSVDYVGIASKPPESYRERVLKFLTKKQATFENYLLNQESTEWFDSIELAAIPAVFVFDRDGNLKKRFDNDHIESEDEAFTYENVNQLIEELLTQQ